MGQPYRPWKGPSTTDVLYNISDDIIEYVDWYCEHGLYLPQEFAKDPAAWTQILRDIQAGMYELQKSDEDVNEKLLYDGCTKYYKYAEHLFKHP